MTIALVGNPNSGKSTLFNALTGLRRRVGNFPGVTVDTMRGALKADPRAALVDLPGTYSLTPFSGEERVVRDFLRNEKPDAILNVVDATCPERGLYLTLQLLELNIPVAVALNMTDEVRAAGGSVDARALSDALGAPVIAVAAAKGEGVADAARAAIGADKPRFSGVLETKNMPPEQAIAARYAFIEKLCAKAFRLPKDSGAQRRAFRADLILTHRVLAFPIFGLIMAAVFFLTFGPIGGALGQAFRTALDALFGAAERLLVALGAADWLRGMIVDGILAGMGSVLSFLPTILTLFFLLSLLEDSGYMARMAFVTDRLLRKIGLSGRSFVPALLGLGCSVPAILATRTLPTRRDRAMTILLVPFLSCSAKLPIYAMFAQAFFPTHAALVMTLLYGGGIAAGVPVALLLRRVAFPGEPAPFLLELPAYRMPTLRSSLALVRTRTAAFVKCAMTTLLLASIAVWALQRVDLHANPVASGADSALAAVGRALSPAFLPLGFADWRAVTALIAGLMAKEGVLASLGILLGASGAALPAALRTAFTQLQAASFLAFTLLYMPCVAAFAAARRELGKTRYALGAAAFQTGFAWLCALIVYNVGRLAGFS